VDLPVHCRDATRTSARCVAHVSRACTLPQYPIRCEARLVCFQSCKSIQMCSDVFILILIVALIKFNSRSKDGRRLETVRLARKYSIHMKYQQFGANSVLNSNRLESPELKYMLCGSSLRRKTFQTVFIRLQTNTLQVASTHYQRLSEHCTFTCRGTILRKQ
jgi:hypothetical protein